MKSTLLTFIFLILFFATGTGLAQKDGVTPPTNFVPGNGETGYMYLRLSWDGNAPSYTVIWRMGNDGKEIVDETSNNFYDIGFFKRFPENTTFYWQVIANYKKGVQAPGPILHFTTGYLASIDEKGNYPTEFNLSQNFPNPFNPTTTIEFTISRAELVSLKIYNLLGQEVATLVNKQLPPGTHQAIWDATSFPSGVYIYRIKSADFERTKKMVLAK